MSKKVEMKIICNICKRKFKTFVFSKKICPKCQLKKTSRVVDVHKKNGITPYFDVYIGRRVRRVDWTHDSKWGNYFYDDLEAYENHVRNYLWNELDELEGKILGCWCINTKETSPVKCHGQILMRLLQEKKGVENE